MQICSKSVLEILLPVDQFMASGVAWQTQPYMPSKALCLSFWTVKAEHEESTNI